MEKQAKERVVIYLPEQLTVEAKHKALDEKTSLSRLIESLLKSHIAKQTKQQAGAGR